MDNLNTQNKHNAANTQDIDTIVNTSAVDNNAFIGDTSSSTYDTTRLTAAGDIPTLSQADNQINNALFTAVGDDQHHSVESFLQRPYIIDSFVWTPGLNPPRVLSPWTLFKQNPVFDKLRGFYAVDFTFCFRLVSSSSPHTSGVFQLAFTPCVPGWIELLPKVDDPNDLAHTLSGGPSIIHSISSTSSSELRVHYKAPAPFFDLNNRDYGRLYLHTIGQIRASDNNEPVSTKIYMWLEDVKTYGTNVKFARYQGVSQVEEAAQRNGVVSKATKAISNVANQLTKIPVLSDIAGPVSWISDAVGGVSSMFGFSKPFDNTPSMPMVINPYKEFALGKSNWAVGTKLAVNDDASTHVYPLGTTPDDEMSIAKLCEKPNWYHATEWTTSQAAGEMIRVYHVSPYNCQTDDTKMIDGKPYQVSVNTTVSYLARLFHFWRGTMLYTFTIAATKFHSGRLRFVYVPEAYLQESNVVYTEAYSHVLDVRESTTVTIAIPYIANRPWSRCSAQDFEDSFISTTGTLYIFVEEELRVASEVSKTIDILTHVSARDMQFAVPHITHQGVVNSVGFTRKSARPELDIEDYTVPPQYYEPKRAVYQGLSIEPTQQAPAEVNITNCNNKDRSDIAYKLAIGDPVLSLRTIAKRLHRDCFVSYTIKGNQQLVVLSNTLSNDDYPSDYLHSICALYAFRSGGTRIVVNDVPAQVEGKTNSNVLGASFYLGTIDGFINTDGSTNIAYFTEYGRVSNLVQVPHLDVTGALQVEVPFYTTYAALWNAYYPINVSKQHIYMPEIESQFVVVPRNDFLNNGSVAQGDIFRSGADDFNCGYIIGAPMSLTAPPQ